MNAGAIATTLADLPVDLIALILEFHVFSPQDVFGFRLLCRKMNYILESDKKIHVENDRMSVMRSGMSATGIGAKTITYSRLDFCRVIHRLLVRIPVFYLDELSLSIGAGISTFENISQVNICSSSDLSLESLPGLFSAGRIVVRHLVLTTKKHSIPAPALTGLQLLNQLVHLDTLRIEGFQYNGFESVALKHLRVLDIKGRVGKRNHSNTFTNVISGSGKHLEMFETIGLVGNLQHVCRDLAEHATNLKVLHIGGGNDIGPSGCSHLHLLQHLVDLRIGPANAIGGEGMTHIANVRNLTTLEFASGNNLELEGFRALYTLVRLRYLVFPMPITGCPALICEAVSTGLPGLVSLHIVREGMRGNIVAYNLIGTRGAKALSSLANLRILKLDDNNAIGDAGLAEFGKLKKLQIFALGEHHDVTSFEYMFDYLPPSLKDFKIKGVETKIIRLAVACARERGFRIRECLSGDVIIIDKNQETRRFWFRKKRRGEEEEEDDEE